VYPIRKFAGHFAGAFIPCVGADGVVKVLVLDVLPITFENADTKVKLEKTQTKMPGGCAESQEENDNLSLALVRELRREIAKCDDFWVEVGEQISKRPKPGRNHGDPEHLKFFFYAQFQGELRTEAVVEDEGDEILSPPFWVEARQLWGRIFDSHRRPLLHGLQHLARQSPEVAYRYANFLEACRTP
jgi:hypothetical protein